MTKVRNVAAHTATTVLLVVSIVAVVTFSHFGWWPWPVTPQTQVISGYGYLYDDPSDIPYYRLDLTFHSSKGPFCVGREIDLGVVFTLLDLDVLDDRGLELELFGAHLKGNTSGPARIPIDVPQHTLKANITTGRATIIYHQPSIEASRLLALTLCVAGRGIGTNSTGGNDTGGWVCKDSFFVSDDVAFLYVAPLQAKLQEELNRTLLAVGILAVLLAARGIPLQALQWLQRRHR